MCPCPLQLPLQTVGAAHPFPGHPGIFALEPPAPRTLDPTPLPRSQPRGLGPAPYSASMAAAASSTPGGSPSAAASPATPGTSVSWTSAGNTAKTAVPVRLPRLVCPDQDRSFPPPPRPRPLHPLLRVAASRGGGGGSLSQLRYRPRWFPGPRPTHKPLPSGMPTCRCPTGFTGPKCTQQVCAGYCANNSTCTVNQGNQPQCRCLPGFLGDRCQYRE